MIFSPLRAPLSSFIALIILCGCGFFFAQCSDDESPLPALQSELLMVRTDGAGRVATLHTDEGEHLLLSNNIQGLRRDTTYRVLATFRKDGTTLGSATTTQHVWVQQLLPIPTAPPLQLKSEEIKRDPVVLLALWHKGDYLNLRFAIPRSVRGQHTIGWALQGVAQYPDGHRRLQLLLYHNAHGDRNDYTEEAYLSCPLRSFSQWLTPGRDSIALSINTPNGTVTQVRPY